MMIPCKINKGNHVWREKLQSVAVCLRKKGFIYTIHKILCEIWWKIVWRWPGTMLKGLMSQKFGLSRQNVNIAFLIGGGFGDNLIFANYLACLKERFPQAHICADVYFSAGFSQAGSLFEREGAICHRYYPFFSVGCFGLYDWAVEVNRYPRELYPPAIERIETLSPELAGYIRVVERFYQEHQKIFDQAPVLDGRTAADCARHGIKRLQQPDFNGCLGIEAVFRHPLFCSVPEQPYLASCGIDRAFFTFHRGGDCAQAAETVKMWPQRYYEELISLMRELWPEYLFIQLGVSKDRCPPMKGIDIHLEGCTTMEQVKVLLKHSELHIDAEGGLVHLRQALQGGPSAVLFGATSLPFFSYEENLNICGDGCSAPCEWATETWLTHCVRGFQEPPCMTSITPRMVLTQVLERYGRDLFEKSN